MNSELFTKKNGENLLSLTGIIDLLWQSRRLLLKFFSVFVLIGLFVAIFSKKEFKAAVTFIPQTSGTDIGGSLGGLAALAGFNLPNLTQSASIPATLYPEILGSLSFQKKLLYTELNFEGFDEPLTYYTYYTQHYRPGVLETISEYTLGLPGTILLAIKGEPSSTSGGVESGLESVTFLEHVLIKQLRKQVSIEVNEFDGYVLISANLPEPRVAAEMTQVVQEKLQKEIILLKSKKAKEKLGFIQRRYVEKKSEFQKLQDQLARVQDNNLRLTTEGSKIALNRLQSEYDVALKIYTELSTQLETQRIQVKEDTPVFTTINPVSIPMEKSKPQRFLILFVWSLIGLILAVFFVIGRAFVSHFRLSLQKG